MQTKPAVSFVTLVLLISFASVNAVLFTPALPKIASFFAISDEVAQYTVSWFLIGYALGQLIYGPLTSRYGKKTALYVGILLQVGASLGCVLAGLIHFYPLLVISRFMMALGSGVGLKMSFTLVNEHYEPSVASQKTAYLMLSFAITPGLSVALGGFLNAHFGWVSCFIGGAMYGLVLLSLVAKLPEVKTALNSQALKWSHLQKTYRTQFRQQKLLAGGLLMGSSTAFVYIFAAIAPFVAINRMGMSSERYGAANIIPSIGLVMGSLGSAWLVKKYPLEFLIKLGLIICTGGTLLMAFAVGLSFSVLTALFLPMMIIYLGLSFVLPNVSSLAMSLVTDKSHGSAVMNFINMGFATFMVLSLSCFSIKTMLLPVVYLILCVMMLPMYYWLVKE